VTVKKESPACGVDVKYPFISITKSVSSVTKTEMAPLSPAGTIAAFAVIAPVSAFSVETKGWDCPAGQVVRYPSGPRGTTVMFSEYAATPEKELLQVLAATGTTLS
jgi:hypothetical protein